MKRDYKKLAYALARRLDQIMNHGTAHVSESKIWCWHADRQIKQAGVIPGSSKRYSPQKDKS